MGDPSVGSRGRKIKGFHSTLKELFFLLSLYAAKNANAKRIHDWSSSRGRFMKRAIGDETCRGYFNEYCKYAGVSRAADEPLLPKVKKLRNGYYKLC